MKLPAPVDISDPFRALSDPTRREIVSLLAAGPLPVRVIAGHFPAISRPAVSKHLRVLREGGLVSEERSGRERYYSLDLGAIGETLDWMEDIDARAAKAAGAAGARVRLPAAEVQARGKRGRAPGPAARRAAGSDRPTVEVEVLRPLEPGSKAKSPEPVEPVLAPDASADSNDWKSW